MAKSIIIKVQNKYSDIEKNVCGMAFIKKASEFYEVVGKVNNSKAGLNFMKSIAFGLGVTWSMMVEYLYYLMKEKNSSLYKDNESSLDYQSVCLNLGGVFGKLLNTKADSVYANKYLFDAVVANTEADAEEWLQEAILEQYGWHNVMREIYLIYEQYLLDVEAKGEDYDYIKRVIESINKEAVKAAKKDKKFVISEAIIESLTEDEYSALCNWIQTDEEIAQKLHLMMVDGKVYSDKEEVKTVAPIESKESLEDKAAIAEAVEPVEEVVEETKDSSAPTMTVPSKKAISKKDVEFDDKDAVLVRCEEDGTTQKFNSPKEASDALGIKVKYIHKRLNGDGKKTGKGKDVKHYTFKYVLPHIKKGNLLQIDPQTNDVVAAFKRVTDAEREYGFKPTRLNGVLKTVNKLCDGYMWMYEADFREKHPSKEYSMVA